MEHLIDIEKTVIEFITPKLTGVRVKNYAGEFDTSSSERISFKAPALFVSFLGAKLESTPTLELNAKTNWSAFLVLHSYKKQNSTEKQLLENTLAVLNGSNLGLKALPVVITSFEQILTRQIESKNLSVWVIRWSQDIKILTEVDNSVAPEKVLVSHEPNTGISHIDDYTEV